MLLASFPALAGSPLKTNINGLPFHWGSTVVFHPESGELKAGVFDHDQSVSLIRDALDQWAQVPGVNLNIVEGETLADGGDTHAGNYTQFYKANPWHCYDNDPSTPCNSPIIFDEDGSIIEDLFGSCSQYSILGFSGFSDVAGDSGDPTWTQLKRGQAIFSGACIAPAQSKPGCQPCNVVLEPEEVKTLVLHEMGHFLGLGHAQVNPDSYLNCHAQGTCTEEIEEHLPTMFPLLMKGAKMLSLHRDDILSMQRLYGNPDAGTCQIKGKVLSADGTKVLRGVEVVARNTEDSQFFTDAFATISGEMSPKVTATGKETTNCLENCGDFTLSGLKPGETYQVCVQRILENFTGTKFVGPADPPFQGVDQDCPESLTFTCQCSGGECDQWQDVKVLTNNQGVDFAYAVSPESPALAAGCSLSHRFTRSFAWYRLAFVSRIFFT